MHEPSHLGYMSYSLLQFKCIHAKSKIILPLELLSLFEIDDYGTMPDISAIIMHYKKCINPVAVSDLRNT